MPKLELEPIASKGHCHKITAAELQELIQDDPGSFPSFVSLLRAKLKRFFIRQIAQDFAVTPAKNTKRSLMKRAALFCPRISPSSKRP